MKKSWHPLLLKNQERVWKQEQKALEEQKKLDQLKKELEEERQIQELKKLQEAKGGRRGPERLDWMYAAAPGGQKADVSEDLEEYLLGKKKVDTKDIDGGTSVDKLRNNKVDVFDNVDTNANTPLDMMSKLRDDPLLSIKKMEQANMKLMMLQAEAKVIK